ncbi:glycosyltransferase [Cryobacterium sp. PH29-G1]|uniref:glycosyltransferase n=1 Tax=Cryobacterium sp. PH29-G1 TaxID=3046211 RepID=UPI0024BA3FE5|nr:glycosyltransferase [Cryobacterium sp. PH29-G1]MDJ0347969.1 glycosyltransferase [Cryobacterium sp. PH29-G1]
MSVQTSYSLDPSPTTPRKLLLVASTGGHLAQLVRLAPGLGASPSSLWVTFDSMQSRSLLAGRRRIHVPYVRPRDYMGMMRAAGIVRRVLQHETFDGAVSTGAGLAVAALPQAAISGVPSLYIESVSRVEGPSLSGRMLAASHLVSVRTQHPAWASNRWRTHPSVLSTYQALNRRAPDRPSLFVTLGTIEGYRFDSLVDAVLASGLADERTVWQLGFTTNRSDLPGQVHQMMPAAKFVDAALNADVVITHAGVGTFMGLLEMGIYPVIVTRRKYRGEHVDDHQMQIAELAEYLGVARAVDAPDLTADVIRFAAGRAIDTGVRIPLPSKR